MTETTQGAKGYGSDAIASERGSGNGITQAAHVAGERLEQLTGQSGTAWLKTVEQFARTHPIQSALIVLGAMYVLKKFR